MPESPMADRDETDDLLSAYFRDRIDRAPSVVPPPIAGTDGRVRRAAVGLWLGRVAVAALLGVALALPFIPAAARSPSARGFAAIHERLGTGDAVGRGLAAAAALLSDGINPVRR